MIGLKPSRSRNITPSRLSWRLARITACFSRSWNSVRLGRPVSASCIALWAICISSALALHRVGDRAADRGAVDATLDQVVLRALLHGLDREQLVLKAAQDHDRHVGRGGPQLHQRLEAARVRQREVEQHAVGALGHQLVRASVSVRDVGELELRARLRQQLLHEAGVAGVVLDQQDREGLRPARRRSPSWPLGPRSSGRQPSGREPEVLDRRARPRSTRPGRAAS